MSQSPSTCPACGGSHLEDLGALPPFPPGLFGGQPTDLPFTAGHLVHCPACDFKFRSPCPTDQELTALYEGLPDTVWEGYEERPYWPLALGFLNQYAANRKVLDVGCFGGDLLDWMPADWQKHGVEPCKSARELAIRRGITLAGRTAEDLVPGRGSFGAIVSFDVIEHITRPLAFLERLKAVLAPGGCLVLLTGATDSLPYRLFGRHYWYGSFPEHVSFYSLAWFTWAADRLGMKVAAHRHLGSERRNWKLWAKQLAQISVHSLFSLLREWGVSDTLLGRLPVIGRAIHWKTVPWWKQATDHIMVVLVRK